MTGLIRGVEYSVSVFGISDGNGITGDKANLLMTLDGEYVTYCGNKFHIQIFAHNAIVYNITSLTTSVNVTGLIRGVEYSVSVFGICERQ